MASAEPRKKPAPRRGGVVSLPPGRGGVVSEEEARVRAIAEIVSAMAERSRRGEDVDLNALKSAACRRYGLARAPKLVEMIAAVPDADRAALLPRLRAKPVRTASTSPPPATSASTAPAAPTLSSSPPTSTTTSSKPSKKKVDGSGGRRTSATYNTPNSSTSKKPKTEASGGHGTLIKDRSDASASLASQLSVILN